MIKKMETAAEIVLFWQKKRQYEEEDVFPNLTETGAELEELIEWFRSEEYHQVIMSLHTETTNGNGFLQFIFFYDEQENYLGLSMYKIYKGEDGKGFILDFCVDSSYRNHGLGKQLFAELEVLMKKEGARYLALNTSNQNNLRFWQRTGFTAEKELDENGEVLYCKY